MRRLILATLWLATTLGVEEPASAEPMHTPTKMPMATVNSMMAKTSMVTGFSM